MQNILIKDYNSSLGIAIITAHLESNKRLRRSIIRFYYDPTDADRQDAMINSLYNYLEKERVLVESIRDNDLAESVGLSAYIQRVAKRHDYKCVLYVLFYMDEASAVIRELMYAVMSSKISLMHRIREKLGPGLMYLMNTHITPLYSSTAYVHKNALRFYPINDQSKINAKIMATRSRLLTDILSVAIPDFFNEPVLAMTALSNVDFAKDSIEENSDLVKTRVARLDTTNNNNNQVYNIANPEAQDDVLANTLHSGAKLGDENGDNVDDSNSTIDRWLGLANTKNKKIRYGPKDDIKNNIFHTSGMYNSSIRENYLRKLAQSSDEYSMPLLLSDVIDARLLSVDAVYDHQGTWSQSFFEVYASFIQALPLMNMEWKEKMENFHKEAEKLYMLHKDSKAKVTWQLIRTVFGPLAITFKDLLYAALSSGFVRLGSLCKFILDKLGMLVRCAIRFSSSKVGRVAIYVALSAGLFYVYYGNVFGIGDNISEIILRSKNSLFTIGSDNEAYSSKSYQLFSKLVKVATQKVPRLDTLFNFELPGLSTLFDKSLATLNTTLPIGASIPAAHNGEDGVIENNDDDVKRTDTIEYNIDASLQKTSPIGENVSNANNSPAKQLSDFYSIVDKLPSDRARLPTISDVAKAKDNLFTKKFMQSINNIRNEAKRGAYSILIETKKARVEHKKRAKSDNTKLDEDYGNEVDPVKHIKDHGLCSRFDYLLWILVDRSLLHASYHQATLQTFEIVFAILQHVSTTFSIMSLSVDSASDHSIARIFGVSAEKEFKFLVKKHSFIGELAKDSVPSLGGFAPPRVFGDKTKKDDLLREHVNIAENIELKAVTPVRESIRSLASYFIGFNENTETYKDKIRSVGDFVDTVSEMLKVARKNFGGMEESEHVWRRMVLVYPETRFFVTLCREIYNFLVPLVPLSEFLFINDFSFFANSQRNDYVASRVNELKNIAKDVKRGKHIVPQVPVTSGTTK